MAYCPPRRLVSPGLRIAGVAIITVLVTLALMQLRPAAGLADSTPYQSPTWAIALHLATVLPALVLGAVMLVRRKGDRAHRMIGRVWMAAMAVTAVTSFWIRGESGSLSGIHLLSAATLFAVPMAIWRIRAGDVRAHRQITVSLYVGLIVAGVFALAPDRLGGQFVLSFFG